MPSIIPYFSPTSMSLLVVLSLFSVPWCMILRFERIGLMTYRELAHGYEHSVLKILKECLQHMVAYPVLLCRHVLDPNQSGLGPAWIRSLYQTMLVECGQIVAELTATVFKMNYIYDTCLHSFQCF